MPRVAKPLTDTQIRALKPKDKLYEITDGNGLKLRVNTSGNKAFLFNYRKPFTEKRTNISLGSYPALTLKGARKLCNEYRSLITNNIDPKEHREQIKASEAYALNNTFSHITRAWLETQTNQLKPETIKDNYRSLERNIFPYIGNKPINKLKAQDFIQALRPVEQKGALETVRRLCQRINCVMNYAVNSGLIDANPAIAIKEVFAKPVKRNLPSIKPHELPKFMADLNFARINLQTRCVIEFQLLTMTRPIEATSAEWSEINFDESLWTIPSHKMKKNREHKIPLSSQALSVLEFMQAISGHRQHIFPSMKSPKQSMNSQTPNMAIKRMGYGGKLVAHGLRSLASTTLNEQGHDPDVIETALAHVDSNSTRRAYNRAEYLEQRRTLMQDWGDTIEKASKGSLALMSRDY